MSVQWEYVTVGWHTPEEGAIDKALSVAEVRMKAMGDEGWELVSVTCQPMIGYAKDFRDAPYAITKAAKYIAFFKRPVPSPS